jgi:hypothetical protein
VDLVTDESSRSCSFGERILIGQLAEVLWATRPDEETGRIRSQNAEIEGIWISRCVQELAATSDTDTCGAILSFGGGSQVSPRWRGLSTDQSHTLIQETHITIATVSDMSASTHLPALPIRYPCPGSDIAMSLPAAASCSISCMRIAKMGTDRKPLAHPLHQRSDTVLN